ncbi:diflavin flavoprotein [Oscillatoria sp. CS-180]|uniref:diflavin flavoprotein n=1 Tax=Oscillatoria sp. CS-180 TaxID=3021720 RepID=UPI00232A9E34|nr:diflavin flavoprotein [Oscillatoria sp. CS-180]MDB9525116.1 diflavin flavoprotein [Oscillatoria sp. CS-180]
MTYSTAPNPVSLPTAPRPRDVQVADIGQQTQVLRSRAWERLKFEVEYARRHGTTANSYLIRGNKTALLDPPGESFTTIYLEALQQQIDPKDISYIITSHVNSNRMATLKQLRELAPQAIFVCSRPAANTLKNTAIVPEESLYPVRSGDSLELGQGHRLEFITVPTPRWPDGLCTYDAATKILYSDKLFGAHICSEALWDESWRQLEADRRYYFDCLHALQARQVETMLNRLEPFSLQCIAPGHGPLVRYSLSRLCQDYRQWCQQQIHRTLRVALLYTSAYGNTAKVADAIAKGLIAADLAVESINCEFTSPDEIAQTVKACDGFIIGSPTLGGHAPVQIQTALGTILANVSKTKPAGVFGSYGWSGEAIDLLEQKLRDAGYRFGFEPIRVRFTPNQTALTDCETAGTQFAQRLRKRLKQQVSRQAITTAQADRTAQAIGRIIGSLCVATVQQDNIYSGILTTWISQASFSPPGLMLALPSHESAFGNLQPGQSLVLNILKEGRTVRRHFTHQQATQFTDCPLATQTSENGGLIIADALAYLECTVESVTSTGDHQLIYAKVLTGNLLEADGMPALQHRKSGSQY